VDLMISKVDERLRDRDMGIELRPAAKTLLSERGYDPVLGARPLRRTIQREVDNKLSSMLLDGRLLPGQHVTVAAEGDSLAFRVTDRDQAQIPAQAAQTDQEAASRQG
jgi:ATP-dependent Clp protease ATP-binding subunit ClpC